MSGRRYTPFAQWKFREFNELPHLFRRRLNESYPLASMYIGQFPNENVTLLVRYAPPITRSVIFPHLIIVFMFMLLDS